MEHTFKILQGNTKAKILIYTSTVLATVMFFLYIAWMVFLNYYGADAILGLLVFLLSGLVLYDLLLYKVVITKEEFIITRLFGRKKIIAINKMKRKMQLVYVTGYGISNHHLFFYSQGEEYKIRYVSDSLITYLTTRGFNISKQ